MTFPFQVTATGAPLAGVRVLDLTRLLPGPVGTQHLADLGADVIKIEDTGAGDYAPPACARSSTATSAACSSTSSSPRAWPRCCALCRHADVLVEGFRPGVMARLGVGYEAVAAVNPRIVYCSITGFGQTGPLRDAARDTTSTTAALAGVADQIGDARRAGAVEPAHGRPAGRHHDGALVGILAALFDAARTGRGRHVDIAMADGALAHAVLPLAGLHQHGEVPRDREERAHRRPRLLRLLPHGRRPRRSPSARWSRKFWEGLCRQSRTRRSR